jgi:hypothetical protein
LVALSVTRNGAVMPPHWLRRFSELGATLRTLKLREGFSNPTPAPHDLSALGALPRLECLTLGLRATHKSFAALLAALPRLRHLALESHFELWPVFRPWSPRDLTALESLHACSRIFESCDWHLSPSVATVCVGHHAAFAGLASTDFAPARSESSSSGSAGFAILEAPDRFAHVRRFGLYDNVRPSFTPPTLGALPRFSVAEDSASYCVACGPRCDSS